MVKTLVFAGLKFTFHKFDQLDKIEQGVQITR